MKLSIGSLLEISTVICWILTSLSVQGQETPEETSSPFKVESLFERGRMESSLNSGFLFSPFIATKNRPVIDYTLSELQLGYMLDSVSREGWLRGNFEAAIEGFGSALTTGPGSYIVGSTLWGRFNFVPRECRFVPYAQAGAGVVFTDIDPGIVGQDFNFNLDIGLGTHVFITRRLALNVEYRYQHISNANLGRHNLGINSHGPVLGMSFFF